MLGSFKYVLSIDRHRHRQRQSAGRMDDLPVVRTADRHIRRRAGRPSHHDRHHSGDCEHGDLRIARHRQWLLSFRHRHRRCHRVDDLGERSLGLLELGRWISSAIIVALSAALAIGACLTIPQDRIILRDYYDPPLSPYDYTSR